MSMRSVEDGLREFRSLEISVSWKAQIVNVKRSMPVVQSTLTSRYAV